MDSLDKRTFAVTHATTPVGSATAKLLASHGVLLHLADSDTAGLEKLAGEVTQIAQQQTPPSRATQLSETAPRVRWSDAPPAPPREIFFPVGKIRSPSRYVDLNDEDEDSDDGMIEISATAAERELFGTSQDDSGSAPQTNRIDSQRCCWTSTVDLSDAKAVDSWLASVKNNSGALDGVVDCAVPNPRAWRP